MGTSGWHSRTLPSPITCCMTWSLVNSVYGRPPNVTNSHSATPNDLHSKNYNNLSHIFTQFCPIFPSISLLSYLRGGLNPLVQTECLMTAKSRILKTLYNLLWCCWLGGRKGIRPVKNEWRGAGMVVCLERGADLHMAQLMPLPLTHHLLLQLNPDWFYLSGTSSPG